MAQKKTGLNLSGRELRIEGRLCRIARLDGDDFKFLDDPEPVLAEVRKTGLRIDLFSFLQGLPELSGSFQMIGIHSCLYIDGWDHENFQYFFGNRYLGYFGVFQG